MLAGPYRVYLHGISPSAAAAPPPPPPPPPYTAADEANLSAGVQCYVSGCTFTGDSWVKMWRHLHKHGLKITEDVKQTYLYNQVMPELAKLQRERYHQKFSRSAREAASPMEVEAVHTPRTAHSSMRQRALSSPQTSPSTAPAPPKKAKQRSFEQLAGNAPKPSVAPSKIAPSAAPKRRAEAAASARRATLASRRVAERHADAPVATEWKIYPCMVKCQNGVPVQPLVYGGIVEHVISGARAAVGPSLLPPTMPQPIALPTQSVAASHDAATALGAHAPLGPVEATRHVSDASCSGAPPTPATPPAGAPTKRCPGPINTSAANEPPSIQAQGPSSWSDPGPGPGTAARCAHDPQRIGEPIAGA